jgi:hypothetical protein
VPPSSTPEPVVVPPEPEPEEPDLGPLPDYILDPDRPRPLEPVPAPTLQQPEIYDPPAPEPEDPLAGLGLKPVTEFPTVESSPERSAPAGRRRLGAAPRSGKVERPSENEPGDEAEEIGWMQGLSNRLSAYSLDAEPSASESSTSDDDAEAEQDDAERA